MPTVHYNLDYLQQVFQGNDAMVRRILDSFEEQVPAYFTEMERRWRSGRWRDIHPLAHKAKSSIGMLGMQALLEEVLALERTSRTAEDPDGMAERLVRARALLDQALDEMRRDGAGTVASPSEASASTSSGSRRTRRRLKRA